MIFTTEGPLYIEPQTDHTWFAGTEQQKEHSELREWIYFQTEVESIWNGEKIWIQYYNRMAEPIEKTLSQSNIMELT